MGNADTLSAEGSGSVTAYRVKKEDGHLSDAHRHFCKLCGSALYVSDPRWPDLVHPFASAIDSGLPTPPEYVHIILDSAVPWAEVPGGPKDVTSPNSRPTPSRTGTSATASTAPDRPCPTPPR